MTLDEIIAKYGTHALDIDLAKKHNDNTIVYAYCHQHDANGEFMINHFLKIEGKFDVVEMDVDNMDDICIPFAFIEKQPDASYEICGGGASIHFTANEPLSVVELEENEYQEQLKISCN